MSKALYFHTEKCIFSNIEQPEKLKSSEIKKGGVVVWGDVGVGDGMVGGVNDYFYAVLGFCFWRDRLMDRQTWVILELLFSLLKTETTVWFLFLSCSMDNLLFKIIARWPARNYVIPVILICFVYNISRFLELDVWSYPIRGKLIPFNLRIV